MFVNYLEPCLFSLHSVLHQCMYSERYSDVPHSCFRVIASAFNEYEQLLVGCGVVWTDFWRGSWVRPVGFVADASIPG